MFKNELLKYKIDEKHVNKIKQDVKKLVFEKLQEQMKELVVIKRKITELKDKMEQLEIRFVETQISKELFEK